MSELGGIRRGGEYIYITHIPGRKKPCLCVGNKYTIYPIAYFQNEEYAEDFYSMLMNWFNLKLMENQNDYK